MNITVVVTATLTRGGMLQEGAMIHNIQFIW
jgi:hypothetical protein